MRKLWIAFALSSICLGLKAQNLFVGASYGVSGYAGDLVPGSVDVLELNPSFGFQLRSNIGDVLSFRGGIQHLPLSGNDQNYASLLPYLERGLAFKNDVWEATLVMELNFLRFGTKRTLSSAYFFGGFSAYRSKLRIQRHGFPVEELSRVIFNGQVLRVQPETGTKRGKAYPLGIGFKIFPSVKSCLELRSGLRIGGGDYLDGVAYTRDIQDRADSSQQATPGGFRKKNDLYFFTGVAITIRVF